MTNGAVDRAPIPFVDGHLHIFPKPLQQAIYAWFARDGWDIAYRDRFETAIYRQVTRFGGVGAAVLVYAHKPGMAHSLNEWLWKWGQGSAGLQLFGTVHPDDPDRASEAAMVLDDFGFRGLKIHANVQRTRLNDPRWTPVYETILERDRCVVVHAGREPHRNDSVGISYLADLMTRFPTLRVQVAHLGFDEIEETFDLMDRYPYLYVDTAAIPGTRLGLSSECLSHLLRRYPDRVIYGSDLPILEEPFTTHWWRVWDAAATHDTRMSVFYHNAMRFWGIPLPS